MFLLFLLIGVKASHAKTVITPMVIFSIIGIAFEFTLGSAHTAFQALAGTSPAFFVFMLIWVGFSYTFVSFVPLTVLQE